jgi:hypothetical protein
VNVVSKVKLVSPVTQSTANLEHPEDQDVLEKRVSSKENLFLRQITVITNIQVNLEDPVLLETRVKLVTRVMLAADVQIADLA